MILNRVVFCQLPLFHFILYPTVAILSLVYGAPPSSQFISFSRTTTSQQHISTCIRAQTPSNMGAIEKSRRAHLSTFFLYSVGCEVYRTACVRATMSGTESLEYIHVVQP